jgi:hypothetical protein
MEGYQERMEVIQEMMEGVIKTGQHQMRPEIEAGLLETKVG